MKKMNEMNSEHQPANEFLDSLASNPIIPYILQPSSLTSHSKTFIDNIFSTVLSYEAISGNITATISDHLPQFFWLLPMSFQILYAINQTSWKETGQNLTNKILFLITLIKIDLKFSNLISIIWTYPWILIESYECNFRYSCNL